MTYATDIDVTELFLQYEPIRYIEWSDGSSVAQYEIDSSLYSVLWDSNSRPTVIVYGSDRNALDKHYKAFRDTEAEYWPWEDMNTICDYPDDPMTNSELLSLL